MKNIVYVNVEKVFNDNLIKITEDELQKYIVEKLTNKEFKKINTHLFIHDDIVKTIIYLKEIFENIKTPANIELKIIRANEILNLF